jgi:predicted transcriptional regulator
MCKIKEMLRRKGPHFNVVSPNTKVLDALTLMQSENYSYVVVMDEENYLGIMSERDYIHKIKVLGSKQETATVKEILNSNLPVVNFEEDLNRCMVLMNVYKTRYLPVFDEFEFKGVLTMNDLMTEILEEKKYDL